MLLRVNRIIYEVTNKVMVNKVGKKRKSVTGKEGK